MTVEPKTKQTLLVVLVKVTPSPEVADALTLVVPPTVNVLG
jgi:hypothetical protein